MLAGLLIIGLTSALIMIPALPEMMDTIESDEEFCNYFEQKDIETVISSIFVTFHSVGEAIGPIANSVLISSFGFTGAHEALAIYVLSFSVLYFLIGGNVTMLIKSLDPYAH